MNKPQKVVLLIVIVVVVLLLLASVARSDDGGFHGKAEFAYLIEGGVFYTNLELGYVIDLPYDLYIDLCAGVETMSEFAGTAPQGLAFAPFRDTYTVGAQFGWRFTYVRFDHYCTHPVWSDSKQFEQKFFAENLTRVVVGVQF